MYRDNAHDKHHRYQNSPKRNVFFTSRVLAVVACVALNLGSRGKIYNAKLRKTSVSQSYLGSRIPDNGQLVPCQQAANKK
jgi:hypothetical protein